MIPLYIVLGTAGSGRREILIDLIDNGIVSENETIALYLSKNELPSPVDDCFDARVKKLSWKFCNTHDMQADPWPENTTTIFFVTDGRGNPVDQIELIKEWITGSELTVAQIITVVNCELAQAHKELLPWYDACIHFTDKVLLNRRKNVSNKWENDFQKRFTKARYPCLFDRIKNGKLKNPAHVRCPEPRRLSQIFDDFETNDFSDSGDVETFLEENEYNENGDTEESHGDPYLKKMANGRREKKIPDVTRFL